MDLFSDLYFKYLKGRVYFVTLFILFLSTLVYLITSHSTNIYIRALSVIAAGLIPACLVSLFWEFFIRRDFLKYSQHQLDEKLTDAHDSLLNTFNTSFENFELRILSVCETRQLYERSGITTIYSNRNEINLPRYFNQAKERIWVIVTSFSYLTETPVILNAIIKKAIEGIDVQILGLAPNTESAKLRSAFSSEYKTLNEEIPVYMEKMKTGFVGVENTATKIKIMLYNKIPTTACFFVDSQMFFCPLLCGKRGRDSIHFHVSKVGKDTEPNQLFDEHEKNFQEFAKGADLFYESG